MIIRDGSGEQFLSILGRESPHPLPLGSLVSLFCLYKGFLSKKNIFIIQLPLKKVLKYVISNAFLHLGKQMMRTVM